LTSHPDGADTRPAAPQQTGFAEPDTAAISADPRTARAPAVRRLRQAATRTPVGGHRNGDTWPADTAEIQGDSRPATGRRTVLVLSKDHLVGVWPAERLAEVMASFRHRGPADAMLPGRIEIGRIVRQCGYVEQSVACLDIHTFPEKPDHMPWCRNPRDLYPHE